MPVVEDFYIIAESGLCLFSKSQKKEVDQALFSGLLTALNSLSEQIASRSIDRIILQNEKYSILKVEHLLFILRTSIKTKDHEIQKELAEMKQIFLNNFSPKELKNWDGYLKRFEILNEKYDKFFHKSLRSK